mmetsp:Transcript_11660/g.29702  ORF Transcript_11660/g.29702 Transcript_11660/m.29702 type:complete len:738 (-) Transcript_11660:373-2586(-)
MASSGSGGVQVVDEHGVLCEGDLDGLIDSSGVGQAGLGYGIVAIMGPQSSGKSTLMNHAFGTSFREMNAAMGRSQTTQGIWMAASPKLERPTLILDLEGTDGRERGEDDTTFERQSALFALAVADVLLINLWHHDIGREQGSGKPLLKTVLQENLKLFNSGRKKRLLFVIRDRSSKTPIELVVATLKEDLEKIWSAITKPEEHRGKTVEEFFNLNFASLPNFEEKEEEFGAEAILLRSRFKRDSDDDGGSNCYLEAETSVPGSALAMSFAQIWQVIQEDKNLDLPAHRVMVATVRCDQTIMDLGKSFEADQRVIALQEKANAGLTPEFGEKCKGVIAEYLSQFDELVEFFDAEVCRGKRDEMVDKLQSVLSSAAAAQFEFCRMTATAAYGDGILSVTKEGFSRKAEEWKTAVLEQFDEAIGHACISDETPREAQDVRTRLVDDMRGLHSQALKDLKLSVLSAVKKSLLKAMGPPLSALFEELPKDTWLKARQLKANMQNLHSAKLREETEDLDLSLEDHNACLKELHSYVNEICNNLVEEAVASAASRIKNVFTKSFCFNSKGMPRVWGAKVDISAINLASRKLAAEALSLLTISQIEKNCSELSVVTKLLDGLAENEGSAEDSDGDSLSAALTSNTWKGVKEDLVLLSPVACRSVWLQMNSEVSYMLSQALAAQEAAKQANNRAPPLWTILAIAALGWNEFVALLHNPILLFFLIFLFVYVRVGPVPLHFEVELSE